MRAVIGLLNYLANTAYEELYAIRKACKYMHQPGRKHFKAVLHLLHHIRCNPPKAIRYYHDVSLSPVADMLQKLNIKRIDPWFLAFSDLSFADCDDMRSTGCEVIMLQGGIVSMSSFVPGPIAGSSAEAECNAQTVTAMKIAYIKQMVMDIMFDNPERNLMIPLFTDNQASIAISKNAKDTKRSKHIERRGLYMQYCQQQGLIHLTYIPTEYQLADLGMKNLRSYACDAILRVLETDTVEDLTKARRTEEG
jgi:hypothetical protein